MKKTILTLIIVLTSLCTALAQNKATANSATEIPAKVSQWIKSELAKAKRKTLMNFKAGEFFAPDTARLIGYIKGYSPQAGFSTGMINIGNDITNEDYPVVVQIHEDGRFESAIPMNYPKYTAVVFNKIWIDFYIQPGQTLAMLLNLEDLRKNIRFRGTTGIINNELFAFQAKLPDLPFGKIYDGIKGKTPEEFKSFLDSCLADYSQAYQRLLKTEKLSKASKNILQNNYQMKYATNLFDYEMRYTGENQMPLEFYNFLQDIPMNNKELLSTQDFKIFINRLEYCQPLIVFVKIPTQQPEKSYSQYLFEELKVQKTPEDEAYLLMLDSIDIVHSSQDISGEEKDKFFKTLNLAWERCNERHGKENYDAYKKKYVDVIKRLTDEEIMLEEWRLKDSVYTNVLKLKPGIVFDVTKIRSLDNTFSQSLKNNKEAAWNFLTALTANIPESFLRSEADRLFLKNFPEEQRTAYKLPDTYEAKIFKDLIAPFKGKFVLVDFWATTCGPCVYNIRQHKTLREQYKDNPNVDFVFITSEGESPLNAYNNFVKEQELINTYRINADQYRYLRQLFRFNGIPRYVLVDKEGRILDDNYDARSNLDEKLKELTKKGL